MSAKVLILAPEKDVHARAVCRELTKLGSNVVVWSTRNVPEDSCISFQLNVEAVKSKIDHNNDQFSMAEFTSVWYRRPGCARATHMPEQWPEALAEWESGRAMEGIYRTLPCFFVNDPRRQQESLIKISQLNAAREVGFVIPDTLVTNDPSAVKEFCRTYSNSIIYKLIDEASWQYFPQYELPRGVPTLPIRDVDLEHLDQVRLSLHLFQERIDKAYDLRVTVIGSEIFAVKIEPQKESALLDWRLDRENKLSTYALPDDLSDMCIKLMKKLDLVYAAFDLCRDRDGRYIFFELNPAGQFLWLEEKLNLPIAHTLAQLLSRGKI